MVRIRKTFIEIGRYALLYLMVMLPVVLLGTLFMVSMAIFGVTFVIIDHFHRIPWALRQVDIFIAGGILVFAILLTVCLIAIYRLKKKGKLEGLTRFWKRVWETEAMKAHGLPDIQEPTDRGTNHG